MANVALLQNHKFTAFCWFIESGTVVDSITVAGDAKPDTDPEDNWPHLGCVLDLTPFRTLQEDEDIQCPNFASGGYDIESEPIIQTGGFVSTLAKTNSLVRRLELGLPSTPVADTVLEPFKSGANAYLDGWLKLRRRRVGSAAGEDVDYLDLYCRMTLEEDPVTGPSTARPSVRFTRLASIYNTFQLKN